MSNLSDLEPGNWNVDASHSEVGFIARHLMVSKVRGQFKNFSAVVSIAQPFENSTVEATVQLASVDTNAAGRDTHLKSADFFDVENNPAMTFTSTKVTNSSLEGDLTIKGVTKPVAIPFEYTGSVIDPWGNERAGFEGSVTVNRSDWGVNWNTALEAGGVLVSEKVTLEFDIAAIKAKPAAE